MTQLAIDFARAARDDGMRRAEDAANDRVPSWSEVAFQFVKLYAQQHRGARFIGRDITEAAAKRGIESPASPKAWGAPIQRAVRERVIRKLGYAPDPNRHMSPVPEYTA